MIKTALAYLIVLVVRALLSLRYRIQIQGLEALQVNLRKDRGILFLPNHPAEIDPVILEALLHPSFSVRPLVIDYFYHLKGFRWLMRLIRALELPDMDEKSNRFRAKRIEKNFTELLEALRKGDSLLLYPAGRLKRTGVEKLGGASLAHRICQQIPDLQVVLVRTTGLWGSQFSRALTGSSPSFGAILLKGFVILCKNGFFFTPRRKVDIEFENVSASLPREESRLFFNQHLEAWYNRSKVEGENLSLVPYAFWSKSLPQVSAPVPSMVQKERGAVSSEIVAKVRAFLSELSRLPEEKIERDKELSQDLGLDSLDLVQITLFLDEKFEISNLPPGVLLSVEDVLQAAAGHMDREKEEGKPLSISWPEEKRKKIQIPQAATTLIEAFLLQADRMGSAACCADGTWGVMSFRQMKRRVLLLARHFRSFPEERIGVMLPSSVAAYTVILALMLARKVPVMLNWTVGLKALDHAIDLLELQRAITSMRFLDKIQFDSLGKVEEMFYFLEDVKGKISLKDGISALFSSLKGAKRLVKNPPFTAVFLFTSGTEAVPKSVPLSHENILSNMRAACEAVQFSPQDIFYGVLPPFHSFGFSPTGLFPLLSGLRVAYAPDPTDSYGMAKDIALYHPTLFCAAPSFITALFQAAKSDQLSSLKLIVSGAERTPSALFDYVGKHLPGVKLLEGYGITECSPVVSLDRVEEAHVGVGKPLPGIEIVIIDTESHEKLPIGKEGEICIAGPNVFSGYYGTTHQPFLNVNNRSFFLSGDRGYLDPEGHLILTGRSKRFVKIGGEMIGLSGIESELAKAFEKEMVKKEGPSLVVSTREIEANKPELIVFTTLTINREVVNEKLRESGFGRLVKIAEVYHRESIPILSTGKVNYRALNLSEDVKK